MPLPRLSGYPYLTREPEPCPIVPRKVTLRERLACRGGGVVCRVCGTPITAPMSVARGVGPVCHHRMTR